MAIEKYRLEHFGRLPGFPGGDTTASADEKTLAEQLTRATTIDSLALTTGTESGGSTTLEQGQTSTGNAAAKELGGSSGGFLGPYLSEMPENPMNGDRRIRVVPLGSSDEAMAADDTRGWVYRADDGRFQSNVSGKCLDGMSYGDM